MKKCIQLVFVIILMIISLFILMPMKQALLFYERNSDEIAAYLPLQTGQTFDITFVHSIHLSDVVEKYEIKEDQTIKQYEIVFEQFGIGMPSTVDDSEQFVYENGKYHIKNMNQVFDSMKIRNGKTVSHHRLTWRDHHGNTYTVPFNDYFEQGNWYTLKVERISLLTSWKEVKIHERVQK